MSTPGSPAIYLDNAATSFPKPDCVYEAVSRYMTQNGAPCGRGSYSAGETASQLVTECRQRIARLLGAPSPSQIAFTFNCTDSLNLLIRGLLRVNDRVVTTSLEHNSVLRPVQQLQAELNLDVCRVEFVPATLLLDLDQLQSRLREKPTRLVVVNHASNVTGTVQPVQEVCRIAHSEGALVLVDAAQTAGHVPFDITATDVDFVATAGHKGLLGPLGTGVVYVKDGMEHQLRSARSGGTGTQSESLVQPTQMPEFLESGNFNMPGIAGLGAAAGWLLENGVVEIHNRINKSTNRLRERLNKVHRVSIHGDLDALNAGIVSFVVDRIDSREAATILDQAFGIQCRAGFHCAPLVHEALKTQASGGSIRFSPGLFTTDGEIDAAADAIEQLCESM